MAEILAGPRYINALCITDPYPVILYFLVQLIYYLLV